MNPPPLASTPPLPPPAPDRGVGPSAPVGQRLWKGFGSTPWWRLVVGGLIVLVSVALFTLPFDSVRLAQKHTSAAARQEFKVAIQKQILERARTGLVGVRIIAPDAQTIKDIDNAIEDVSREISTDRVDVTLNNVGELKRLIEAQCVLPGYEMVMKASHTFNLLDARGAISVTERAAYIGRVRTLSRAVAQAYYESREKLGFPMVRAS